MMKIVFFLFFLIFTSYSSGQFLPPQLKCVDKLCTDKVSMGRTLQLINPLFGDLKEVKKSVKVNIRGKNIDNNNSLWLIELDGLVGFIDLSFIKENKNSIVNDLEIVNNPYYEGLKSVVVDETEDVDDEEDMKLFSNSKGNQEHNNNNNNKIIKNDETGIKGERKKVISELLQPNDINNIQIHSNKREKEENVKVDNKLTSSKEDKESQQVGIKEEASIIKQVPSIVENNQKSISNDIDSNKLNNSSSIDTDRKVSQEDINKLEITKSSSVEFNNDNKPPTMNLDNNLPRKDLNIDPKISESKSTLINEDIKSPQVTINKDDSLYSSSDIINNPKVDLIKKDIETVAIDAKKDVDDIKNIKSVINDNIVPTDLIKPSIINKEDNSVIKNVLNDISPSKVDDSSSTNINNNMEIDNKESLNGVNETSDAESNGTSHNSTVPPNFRSPFLRFIIFLESSLQRPIKLFINKSGIDSSIYLTYFVHNWLNMSIDNFLLILSIFFSIIIIIYTPKVFRFTRDWKSECEKKTELIMEMELKLSTIEEVRQKLTIQNRSFETVIEEYKGRVNDIKEDSDRNKQILKEDLKNMKRSGEEKIVKLSRELEKSVERCRGLEEAVLEREAVVKELRGAGERLEGELRRAKEAVEESVKRERETLLQVEELRRTVAEAGEERRRLVAEAGGLEERLRRSGEEAVKLRQCLEELEMFRGVGGEGERREEVGRCLELREVRARVAELEEERERLAGELGECKARVAEVERERVVAEERRVEGEERERRAEKEREAAELKLGVLREYFREKEVDMQRSLGQESVEKSLSLDQSQLYRNKVENLEAENESLSRTVEKLKAEVRESQSFAVKCKNELSSQTANQFMTITNLERELMREKEESKKLRLKLSNYIGPQPPRNVMLPNQMKERPPSRQSGVGEPDRIIPGPPIFPLAMLPQSTTPKPQFSGRNSANSVSKKSNNS